MLAGRFEFRTPSGAVRTGPGGVVHAPRDIPHYFRNVGDSPGRLLVTAHPAGFERFIEEFSRIPSDGPPDPAQMAAVGARYGIEFLPDF